MAIEFRYQFYCRGCGEKFGARRSTALYCSGKCAKRVQRAKEIKIDNGLTRYAKAYNTKCDKLVERRCSGCRAKFFVNGNNAMKRFHSPSCMRKAARFRKSLVKEWKASE